MPRGAREGSSTGIFHVMMRGINHQNIFEDAEDNYQFFNTIDRIRVRYDDDGLPLRVGEENMWNCKNDPKGIKHVVYEFRTGLA